jgi:hypothetical protein
MCCIIVVDAVCCHCYMLLLLFVVIVIVVNIVKFFVHQMKELRQRKKVRYLLCCITVNFIDIVIFIFAVVINVILQMEHWLKIKGNQKIIYVLNN